METLKLRLEIIVTILCLFLVYALAKKEGSILTQAADAPIALHSIQASAPPPMHKSLPADPYSAANQTLDAKTLTTLAQEEAQRMLETGDVSAYQRELKKSGLLPADE